MGGVYGVIVALWMVVLICLFGQYDANDVQAACGTHSGVAQVQDNTWSAGDEKAFVVCRDGTVATIR